MDIYALLSCVSVTFIEVSRRGNDYTGQEYKAVDQS